MTKQTIKILLAVFVLSLIGNVAQAQGGPGDPGVDPDPNPPRTDIPFDGGLSIVAAAGIAYAAKKGYDKRKVKK